MKLDEVRWGIVGCGDVCEVKSGPAALNRAGSRVVHVMRRDGAKAADFARRHGVARWSDEAAAVIGDPDVNAVYVATPPGSHRDLALRVAAAGKPCYVEKPMARTAAECREMNAISGRAGLPLFVAYYRRRLPRWVKLKALIDGGRLGDVTHADYRMTRPHRPGKSDEWRLDPAVGGGGLALDVGSHVLDVLDFLLGPLSGVHGHARNWSANAVEDALALTFAAGDVVGTAAWNFAGCVREDVLTLTGTRGRVTISGLGNEPFTLESAGGTETYDLPSPAAVQRPLAATVIHDLLTGDSTCPSTGRTAERTNAVLDAARAGFTLRG